jgi:protein TonB
MLESGGLAAGNGRRWRQWMAASVVLHLVVLALLLHAPAPRLTAVARPGEKDGHRLLLTYDPGVRAPSAALAAVKPLPQPPLAIHALVAPAPVIPPAAAAPGPTPSTAAATGADALGDGDTTVALLVLHPPPHPDLSQLPSGTRGDVIVDIVIDKTGRIAKFNLEHGLGHGVDDTVLATIQGWTFQPATRNGVPVASEQELLFHYERG